MLSLQCFHNTPDMRQLSHNSIATVGKEPTLDTEASLKQHHISVPYYRIVCPAVYGGEWATAEDRIGPGTFWTPRPDDVESMLRAIFTHASSCSTETLRSDEWKIQIFEIREGIVEEVDNFNPYGRSIHFGERKLVHAASPPRELLDVDFKDINDPYSRLELLLELPRILGREIKPFVDFSKGFPIVLADGSEAFVLPDPKRRLFRIGTPQVDGFCEIARFGSAEKFWSYLDERRITFSNRDDELGVDLYFADFAEAEKKSGEKPNLPLRRRATRTPFRSEEEL
ncbi:MAG: hypothetical protein KDD64_04020 [Bdellovibrionales bacterium]|nr:hypothetical protein [Bdellovibrionales bacterium]